MFWQDPIDNRILCLCFPFCCFMVGFGGFARWELQQKTKHIDHPKPDLSFGRPLLRGVKKKKFARKNDNNSSCLLHLSGFSSPRFVVAAVRAVWGPSLEVSLKRPQCRCAFVRLSAPWRPQLAFVKGKVHVFFFGWVACWGVMVFCWGCQKENELNLFPWLELYFHKFTG